MDDEVTKALKKLKDLAPDALQEAHDEMIDGFDELGRPMAEGYANFELDDKIYKAPFHQLREVLHGPKSIDETKVVSNKFRNRIPEYMKEYDVSDSDEYDQDYYWDKNYNYEYMHPDAEKQRVLGKIKK